MSGFDRASRGLDRLFFRMPEVILVIAAISFSFELIAQAATLPQIATQSRVSGISFTQALLSDLPQRLGAFYIPLLILGVAAACAKLTGKTGAVYRAAPKLILVVAMLLVFLILAQIFSELRTGLAPLSFEHPQQAIAYWGRISRLLIGPSVLIGVATLA